MESYEKEMYDFFTKEENFLSMCKVAKNHPKVIRQLKEEFWRIVLNKLKLVLQSNSSDYSAKITGNITDDKTKIILYKNYWPIENDMPVIAIAIQRLAANSFPFYGPWINNASKSMDIESMYARCRNCKTADRFDKDDDNEFPFFDAIELDFKYDEEYLKILPDKRESYAEMISEKVYELAKIMDGEMDEIAKLTKT